MEKISPVGNKRKFDRVNLDLRSHSRIILPDMDPEWFHPHVKCLGGGGLTFDFPSEFRIGTEIQMRLFYYTDEIDLVGEVVWSGKFGEFRNSTYKCGLMFTKISKENQARIDRIINVHLNHSRATTFH